MTEFRIALTLGLAWLALYCTAQNDASRGRLHIVDTGYARYQGNFTAPFSVAYLGLPYATPPLGTLRFRAPLPLDTSALKKERESGKVMDATSYPDFCVQGSIGQGDAGGAGSEDCLKVNVYVPVNSTSRSNLPVLVYIHGGGYLYGNPRNWPFDHWINQSPNVVVVSVYYRLDSFGFLAHPSFSRSPSSTPATPSAAGELNAGFHDQIEALRWVHANIAAFGGNPSRVTINGQSAGGSSVELHMVANEGMGLFSGAISQSVDREVLPLPSQQAPLFDFYAEQARCGGKTSVGETLTCLRSAPISALARAQDAGASFYSNGSLYNKWRPVLDGTLFMDYPSGLFAGGKFARVPLIVGSTSNETGGGPDPVTVWRNGYPALTPADLTQFSEVYNESQFSSEDEWIRTATGEVNLRCGREILGGAAATFNRKVWTYRYNQPNPTQNEPGITEHAAENWMMFLGTNTGTNGSTTFTPFTPVETAFSQELIAYWLSFVRTGDPNLFRLPRSPEWPAFSPSVRLATLTEGSNHSTSLAGRLGRRAVLQQDPGNSTTRSGILVELEPVGDAARCAFVASKVERTQD